MRRAPDILLCFTLIIGLGLNEARAQVPSEQQAAKETYIDGLRLLNASAQEPRLTTLGINLGYVETDTKPGGESIFAVRCHKTTRARPHGPSPRRS